MRILLTVNAAWNVWNFRRPIVQSMLAEGHSVSILAPSDDASPALERLGCELLPFDMDAKGLNPLDAVKLVRRFRHHFGQARPDAILSYTIKNNIFGAMAATSMRIPFIPTVTGLGTAFLSGNLLQTVATQLYRPAFRSLDTVFFQNPDDRNEFLKHRLVSETQARLLPGSGIDLAHFLQTQFPDVAKPPIFLMVARLLRDKGTYEFVEAARQIKTFRPDARFQLLGALDSENRTAIGAPEVEAWVAQGVVEYLGQVDDVRPHVAAASCVVLPSYREGAPRTLIEAAAMARPVIATDVPGCRSVVDRDVSGFLCEVRNPDSLAAAMRRFLELPHAVKIEMGLAGRAKMEREFDQSIVVSAYRQAIAAAVQAM